MTMTSEPRVRSRWRTALVRDLTGDVLEIGVGTGTNLAYYRCAGQVWAIEPDRRRALAARRRAASARVPVIVDVAAAEELPYESARFDQVVCSLVFCSVTDQRLALAEIRRVLRPAGALHMVEHVRPQNPLLARLFSAATPLWSRLAHNCHLDRPTIDVLRDEGWHVHIHQRRAVFVRLSARPLP